MNFQNALSFARGVITSSSHDNSGPLLPWEKGPFSRIFADDDAKPLSQVSLPEVPIPDNPRAQHHPTSVDELDESFASAKQFFLLTSSSLWREILPSHDSHDSKQEGLRHLAIARFINLVGSFDTCGISQSCDSIWELHESFTAALDMKSTNILVKRSLDLKRFADWCDSQKFHFSLSKSVLFSSIFPFLLLIVLLLDHSQYYKPSTSPFMSYSARWPFRMLQAFRPNESKVCAILIVFQVTLLIMPSHCQLLRFAILRCYVPQWKILTRHWSLEQYCLHFMHERDGVIYKQHNLFILIPILTTLNLSSSLQDDSRQQTF